MGFSEFVLERWYNDKSWGILYPVVSISEIFYSAGIALHRYRFLKSEKKRVRLPAKVISVGNITVGGTGKTSFAIYLAKKLCELGFSPAILVRGYFSKVKEYARLDGNSQNLNPFVFGDEPVMMARILKEVPVWVGRDRTLTGRMAIESGANVLILDDGFQYLKLERDINIVCFNAQSGIGNGSLILKGPLREPLTALARADVVACVGTDAKSREILEIAKRFNLPDPVTASFKVIGLKNLRTAERILANERRFTKVVAFCAIAVPFGFFKTLEDMGFEVLVRKVFRDHHRYKANDIEKIANAAKSINSQAIITTQKDGVKINKTWLEEMKLDVWELEIELAIEREERFLKWLIDRLK